MIHSLWEVVTVVTYCLKVKKSIMKVIQRFSQFVFILTKVSQKKKGCVLLHQCTLVADSPSQEQPGYRDVWSLKFMGPIIYDFLSRRLSSTFYFPP